MLCSFFCFVGCAEWCGQRWRLRTRIGGCEIMKTRETTPELESDGLYSRVACATGAQVLEDETDDDHSYDGRR
ncbi:hypothetical protein U9M48_023744 [Paspalum notatum var. saurae]|uniref:Uncharacterized protein n=1 Tax=Paspalum notatum var. saurae TaxID=547442 RepID=A0AAQ3TMD8_PASNO